MGPAVKEQQRGATAVPACWTPRAKAFSLLPLQDNPRQQLQAFALLPISGTSACVSGCAPNVPGKHSYPTSSQRSSRRLWLPLPLSSPNPAAPRGALPGARVAGPGHLTASPGKGADLTSLQAERDSEHSTLCPRELR